MRDRHNPLQYGLFPRSYAFILERIFVLSLVTATFCDGYVSKLNAQAPTSLPSHPTQETDSEAPSFTFKAITRMVIVEVVARDLEDNPVRDLTAKDLLVSEMID